MVLLTETGKDWSGDVIGVLAPAVSGTRSCEEAVEVMLLTESGKDRSGCVDGDWAPDFSCTRSDVGGESLAKTGNDCSEG